MNLSYSPFFKVFSLSLSHTHTHTLSLSLSLTYTQQIKQEELMRFCMIYIIIILITVTPTKAFSVNEMCNVYWYRHLSVQNTILPNKVPWSVLFLLPGSSYLAGWCVCVCVHVHVHARVGLCVCVRTNMCGSLCSCCMC